MYQLTAMRVFTMLAKNRSFKAAAAEIMLPLLLYPSIC